MHPLDGAYIRLDGAKKRFKELCALSAAIIDKESEIVFKSLRLKPEPDKWMQGGEPLDLFEFARPETPIPDEASVLVAEILGHLRSILEYLVFELAKHDSGSEKGRTQFPIEDTQDGFRRRRKTDLKFVNDSHAAAIERLQPYNGVNWTKMLRTYSNPDKHRHLTIGRHKTGMAVTPSTKPAEPISKHGGFIFHADLDIGDETVQMQIDVSLFIAFNDGISVLDVLGQIIAHIGQLLADFKPEF